MALLTAKQHKIFIAYTGPLQSSNYTNTYASNLSPDIFNATNEEYFSNDANKDTLHNLNLSEAGLNNPSEESFSPIIVKHKFKYLKKKKRRSSNLSLLKIPNESENMDQTTIINNTPRVEHVKRRINDKSSVKKSSVLSQFLCSMKKG